MAWELKAKGEDLCRESAKDKTSFWVISRKITESSFAKHTLLTITLKHEILLISPLSWSPTEFVMICRRDCAAALPGEEKPK